MAALVALPGFAYPRPGRTERVSVGESGSQGNFDSRGAAISDDGRYVVFESISNTLVPGDSNARSDIFLRDREQGSLSIVSVASDGTPADGRSHSPAISADGRYVTFESLATNLVLGDTNGTWDVFVRDLVEKTTERVSISTAGAQQNAKVSTFSEADPSLSANGRHVVFSSNASNLVPDDRNGAMDVFLRDRTTGTTERISVSENGIEGDARSRHGDVSADGRYVAFDSQASTLVVGVPDLSFQVYRKDRVTGAVELVSVSNDGVAGNEASFPASISADGSIVVFDSAAGNLVPNDGTAHNDIFMRDLVQGITQRLSVATSGQAANGASENGVISPDGRFISFSSWATNLSGERDGRWPDVFVHDRVTGETQQVSLSEEERSVPLGASGGVVSEQARVVAFQSAANALVQGDTNERIDIYTRDRGPAVGIVDGPHANIADDAIRVTGDAVFSGVVLAEADDAPDDGAIAADASGTELVGGAIAFRPEADDLAITLRMDRVEGLAAPDSQINVYGISFEIDGSRYEIRSAREGDGIHARHILLLCDPVCQEIAELEGSIGETGDEVRISLPFGTIDAQAGDALSSIIVTSGRGTTASGPAVAQDGLVLPDATIPASTVRVGLVPAGTDASDVVYPVTADVADGHFSAELPRDWEPADYDVWAKACLLDTCEARFVRVTLERDPSPSPSSSSSPSSSPSASPSLSPSPSSSVSASPTQSPDPSPLCLPGRRCETWAAQYQRASDGVGYPRGMSISPDDASVYLVGDYGPTFFERDLHTVALDAKTGSRLWVGIYNSPNDGNETGWTSAASSDLVFAGGDSRRDNGTDLLVVAYDAASGSERWVFRDRGRYDGLNQAKVMTVSDDERILYVSGRMSLNAPSGDFATFALNAKTGERLWFSSYNGTLPDYDDPQGITLSPDGSRLFVTGHSWGRHSGFDYATVAYDAATGQQLWLARYDADFERELAAGIVVSPDGKRVYVGGSAIKGSEDYATVAYDAASGEQLWANLYDHSGLADRAADIAMDPRGEVVIVTGRSRSEDNGDDVATVAYDAVTGQQRWVRRFHGPTLEGHDWGSSLRISPRGSHTFVAGTTTGPERGPGFEEDAATFAYDTRTGATIWEAFYNGPAGDTDDPLNVVMSSDGSWVYPGGLMMHSENLGFSSLAQYFALGYQTGISETADPKPTLTPTVTSSPTTTVTATASPTRSESAGPEATTTSFTERSQQAGQHSDATLFEARLSDSTGEAVPGEELTFELTGAESSRSFTATTDSDGVASVTPTLSEQPGSHQLTVRYAGSDDHEPSSDTTAFVVDKEDSATTLTVSGKGKHRTLTARLSDRDSDAPIATRTIEFYADSHFIGSATNNDDGRATLEVPPRYRGGSHDFEAGFVGDEYYLRSSDRSHT